MSTKRIPIYWDACVYIDCIQQEPTRYPILRRILSEAETGKIVLVASTLILTEVNCLKQSSEAIVKQATMIHDFFENDFIAIKGVDRDTADKAAELCRDYRLKPADAIHVATAVRWGCRCFQTYDGELRGTKKSGVYLLDLDGKIGSPPLKIELPKSITGSIEQQSSLFDFPNAPSPKTDHRSIVISAAICSNAQDRHPLRAKPPLRLIRETLLPRSIPAYRVS